MLYFTKKNLVLVVNFHRKVSLNLRRRGRQENVQREGTSAVVHAGNGARLVVGSVSKKGEFAKEWIRFTRFKGLKLKK